MLNYEMFLSRLSNPAKAALLDKKVLSFETLIQYSEDDLLKIHGIGKASLPVIYEALKENNLCLKNPVLEYIETKDESIRSHLYAVRDAILKVIPHAKERIVWAMPTYWDKYNVIHFAAFKKHLGIYPGPVAIEHFSKKLQDYSTSKGAIQFPYDKINLDLIKEITQWCYETGNHH